MINILTLALLLVLPKGQTQDIVIDKSLAVVNNEVITLSNVSVYYQLLKLQQVKRKPIKLKNIPFKMSEADLKKTLENYIIFELINQEKSKTSVSKRSAPELIMNLRKLFRNDDEFAVFLKSIKSNRKQISILLAKQKASSSFIKDKINKGSIIVTNDELQDYLNRFGIKKTASNLKRVKAAIVKDKYDKRVASFMAKLLERNKIKYLIKK